MDRIKHAWHKVPRHVRKPIVFVVGFIFILLSGAVGWLPGPGGIPLLLIGIAILSTEFAWADRVKDGILKYVHLAGKLFRAHPVYGSLVILICLSLSGFIAYLAFFK